MNIFYLSNNPTEAAQMMVDKHVVKMIVETAQLLSTAHRLVDGKEYIEYAASGRKIKRWKLDDSRNDILYSATHITHPSAIWTRESTQNYAWLVNHFFALCDEYTHRYGKIHSTYLKLSEYIKNPPNNLKKVEFTDPPLAMPDIYKSKIAIDSYRNYYKFGKSHIHKWTNRPQPIWIN